MFKKKSFFCLEENLELFLGIVLNDRYLEMIT